MVRLRFLALIILLTCLQTGCQEDKKEIAVLIYDMEDPFIAGVADSIRDYSPSEANVTFYDCQNSQIIQNELAEELFDEKVDLLVINPVERLSSYVFVQRSQKENIPLVFFNREPLVEDLLLTDETYYVGADASESGRMQAGIIDEYFAGDPEHLGGHDINHDGVLQAVILKGELGHQDAEERSAAVIGTLEDKGYKVEVLVTEVANWNEDAAYRAMEDIMDHYGDRIEVLISNNDAMAMGAVNYLKESGAFTVKDGKVTKAPFPIVSIDGLEMAVQAIEDGYLYGTVINDGDTMAKAISDLSAYLVGIEEELTDFKVVENHYIWIPYKEYSGN